MLTANLSMATMAEELWFTANDHVQTQRNTPMQKLQIRITTTTHQHRYR